jgi:hypothetical protein
MTTASKTEIETWVKALRSGEYKQSHSKLQNRDGHCCLGVACELFIPKDLQERQGGVLFGDVPEAQLYAPDWLKQFDDDFAKRTGIYVSKLNDFGVPREIDEPFSFEEIADLLEAVYLLEVLS